LKINKKFIIFLLYLLLKVEFIMKNFSFLSLALIAATLILNGCGQHDLAEDDIKWSDDNGGTLEVGNLSNKDVVLFYGQVPMPENIMGGVRAGATKLLDVGKHVGDFGQGGYMIVRGITREQYNDNKYNLSEARIEFNAFATYRAGTRYRIEISNTNMGDNAFRVTNTQRIGMELRKDSPDGEKVTYLPALGINQTIYMPTTTSMTLFPVYVFYDKLNNQIHTLHSTSMFESVMVSPRPISSVSGDGILTYTFPNDETMSWEKLLGTLKPAVAYIKAINNVMNQSIYFTRSSSKHLFSQNGYDAIGPGENLLFEVEADEDGAELTLTAKVYNGAVEKLVTFEGATRLPIIKNGYDYTVTVSGSGSTDAGYTATIVEKGKRDLSDMIETK
jgi:hypothetical protein